MRHSLQKQIITIFVLEFIAIFAACAFVSFRNSYSSEIKNSRENARSAVEVVGTIVAEYGLETLIKHEDMQVYEKARSRMRTLCRSFSLDYLYIYTVDEKQARHYVMTVASDDDNDRTAAEKLSFGAVSFKGRKAMKLSLSETNSVRI